MGNKNDMTEKIDRLIQHYQAKADELKKDVEYASDSGSTIPASKAMYALWRTCCNFVADLDELAASCEIEEFVENCDECGFCNNNKGETNMNIRTYAETNMDESCFYGKVEVETNTKSEWENAIRVLKGIHDDSLVCHCNLKENAALIAEILDFDAENKIAPHSCERGDTTNENHVG